MPPRAGVTRLPPVPVPEPEPVPEPVPVPEPADQRHMPDRPDDAEQERYREVARLLHDAARPLRVLAAVRWPPDVRTRFLDPGPGGERLPEVSYPSFDAKPRLDAVYAARRLIYPGSTIDDWFDDQVAAIEATALMLGSLGTPAFHAYSRTVYGAPDVPLRFDPVTPLDLAHRVHQVIDDLARVDLGATPPPS